MGLAPAAERDLDALERPIGTTSRRWPWLLVVAGLVAIVGLGVHGYTAYATIAQLDASSKLATPNPLVMFQDLATNGSRVGSGVESSSRATYSKTLEQYVLDGTGVCLGFVLVVAGVFVRFNE
jgi:hypothetical protein